MDYENNYKSGTLQYKWGSGWALNKIKQNMKGWHEKWDTKRNLEIVIRFGILMIDIAAGNMGGISKVYYDTYEHSCPQCYVSMIHLYRYMKLAFL